MKRYMSAVLVFVFLTGVPFSCNCWSDSCGCDTPDAPKFEISKLAIKTSVELDSVTFYTYDNFYKLIHLNHMVSYYDIEPGRLISSASACSWSYLEASQNFSTISIIASSDLMIGEGQVVFSPGSDITSMFDVRNEWSSPMTTVEFINQEYPIYDYSNYILRFQLASWEFGQAIFTADVILEFTDGKRFEFKDELFMVK